MAAKVVDPFGFGIRRPLRRGPTGDFVSAGGMDLLQSNVGQVMGTMPGELRWRPSFGSNLTSLRHRGNTSALHELARLLLERGFTRWLPRLRLLGVNVADISAAAPNRMVVSIAYQVGNSQADVAQAVI